MWGFGRGVSGAARGESFLGHLAEIAVASQTRRDLVSAFEDANLAGNEVPACRSIRQQSGKRCAACLATRETLASFRHCGCGRVDQEEVCSTCVGVPASYPRVLGARLAPHAGGLEVEAEGSRFSLAWSLLQPVPKPSLEPGLARAKWRFHCINLADQPADFCSGPENQWE
ncbi:unnamed protein product, partial [Effrenium voratum]